MSRAHVALFDPAGIDTHASPHDARDALPIAIVTLALAVLIAFAAVVTLGGSASADSGPVTAEDFSLLAR